MRTKEKNLSDPAVGQGSSRHGRSIVSDNRGVRGKVPASTRNWATVGRIQMERYTHSIPDSSVTYRAPGFLPWPS